MTDIASAAPYRLAAVNELDAAEFAELLGGVFENSPWVAEDAFASRPFASVDELHGRMLSVVLAAPRERQVAFLNAHPELAGRAHRSEVTRNSDEEQAGAGLNSLSTTDSAHLAELTGAYRARHGYPFILAVRGLTTADILEQLADRAGRETAAEFETALGEIAKITRMRLARLVVD
ncbi:2-oxo-4-hydroxy-4-carboxy-5-ureidoimidazoline decarboxylase [Kribbella sp. NPDC059898]|uniref:2-oxo-4-hydroxy-4-carboxy-5-ureidoimidazoline decarboxylase n=1 Tax=Kribbella sp. NPDC059898 TaxID=3346995 RepID=UPI0036523553